MGPGKALPTGRMPLLLLLLLLLSLQLCRALGEES